MQLRQFYKLFNDRLTQISKDSLIVNKYSIKQSFSELKYNLNNLFNKNFFDGICNESGLLCNAAGKEFLKIDFTLFSKPPYEYGYSVPQVFVEIENDIYTDEENGHEICKLAATNAPLKVFITRYFGDWKKDRRNRNIDKLGATLADRFENMLQSYSEIQKNSFISNFAIIICEISNEKIKFITESWNAEGNCFTVDPYEFELI